MSNTPQTEAKRLADWLDGFHKASVHHECAAELRRLDAENQQLKASLALVQQHHATAWNRGHQAGIRADESAVKQAIDAVRADAWGNTQLTNALMQAEAERDQLRAQVERLQGGEPVTLTDEVPAHVAGLLEHRRELDAIEFFESANRDSLGFRRSVRGTYVNPAVARDWKWFQLGMQHATKE